MTTEIVRTPEAREASTFAESRSSVALGTLLLVLWTAASSAGLFWWLFDPDAVYFTLGALTCLIVTIPLTRHGSSLLSPWLLVAGMMYVSCGIRGAAVSAGVATPSRSVSDFVLLGQGPDYFLAPSIMYLAAAALMSLAYTWRPQEVRAAAPSRWEAAMRGPVVALSMPLALVGAGAFVQYIRVTGGLNLAVLSAKRTNIGGVDVDQSYTSHGDLLFLSNFSTIAFWLVVAHYAASGRRMSWATREGWLTAVLGLNAIALPFYASSRSDAVIALLTAAGMALLLRPHAFPVRSVLIGAGAILAIFALMTSLRAAPTSSAGESGGLSALGGALADAAVFNRNLADPYVVDHIYHVVPDRIPYQNGATITTWVVAPVPRSLWPDKPVINTGPLLGDAIFGLTRSGVPPGWVGDLYLNWGLPAVLAGSALIGWLLGQIDQWRRRQSFYTPVFAVLYLPLAITFTKNVISKGLGSAIFNGGLQFALTVLCLVWLSAFAARSRPGLSGGRAVAVRSPRG